MHNHTDLLVLPMREELTKIGFTELRTVEDVKKVLDTKQGTTFLVVNSVCGCAAGNARPAVRLALETGKKPDTLVTVFAGQDAEATVCARSYFPDIPASSPSMFLLKDGNVVAMIPRERIEGRNAEAIANDLTTAFEEHC